MLHYCYFWHLPKVTCICLHLVITVESGQWGKWLGEYSTVSSVLVPWMLQQTVNWAWSPLRTNTLSLARWLTHTMQMFGKSPSGHWQPQPCLTALFTSLLPMPLCLFTLPTSFGKEGKRAVGQRPLERPNPARGLTEAAWRPVSVPLTPSPGRGTISPWRQNGQESSGI